MPHEIRLVGLAPRPFAIGAPSPLARRRLEAAKQEINAARRGKVALPIVGGKSLVSLAREKTHAAENDALDAEGHAKIAEAIAQYAETEVHRPIRPAAALRFASRHSTLASFNNAVLNGHLGDLAALHAHAEAQDAQIVATESTLTKRMIAQPEEFVAEPIRRTKPIAPSRKALLRELKGGFEASVGTKTGSDPEERRLNEATREVTKRGPGTVIADAPLYRHLARSVATASRRVIAAPLQRIKFAFAGRKK